MLKIARKEDNEVNAEVQQERLEHAHYLADD